MSVAELAEHFEKKYAKKKNEKTCSCQHMMCEELGLHSSGKCKEISFNADYMCPTGYLCDVCGQYYSEKNLTMPSSMEELEEPQEFSSLEE